MAENVFHAVQLGRQAGTFASPGSAVPATVLFPVDAAVNFGLDRAPRYPAEDYGRNAKNRRGRGQFGVRAADGSLTGEIRYQDFMHMLEMSHAGDVSKAGADWSYPFEAGPPTLVPYTIEGGDNDVEEAQQRLVSCLVNALTMGYADLSAPGNSPWTFSAEVFAFDREVSPMTAGLPTMADPMNTVQGHLTRLFEGDTSTAFAALAELEAHLIGFTMTATRGLVRRPYGGVSDVALGYGFDPGKSGSTFEAKVAVSTASMSDFHDIWNTSGASLGERRWRVQAEGTGSEAFKVDGRVGIFAVPYDERDGERIFAVSGEFVDDDDLEAPHVITISNDVAAIEPGS